MATQLDFIASLREEEDDHGMSSLETSEPIPDLFLDSKPLDLDLKILFFGPEGVGVTHQDVTLYKTQLFGKSPHPASNRQVLLSDEAPVSSVDRARLDGVLAQLHFDIQPLTRGWTASGNPETLAAQHFNYGLNEHLFREFLEQQIILRLNRVNRHSLNSYPMSHTPHSHAPSYGNMPHGPTQGHASYGGVGGGSPPPGPSLYVTNFPVEWTQQDIGTMFSRFGPLESVALRTGRRGYGTRGAAFVNYTRVEDATRAIEQLNHSGEYRLSVNYARSKTRAI